jgi:hypothetical protein
LTSEARNSLDILVGILSAKGPMTAGKVGSELWATRGTACKCENAQATMFCRPAGRLLHRAQRLGLVRCEDRGRVRLWHVRNANARNQGLAPQEKAHE